MVETLRSPHVITRYHIRRSQVSTILRHNLLQTFPKNFIASTCDVKPSRPFSCFFRLRSHFIYFQIKSHAIWSPCRVHEMVEFSRLSLDMASKYPRKNEYHLLNRCDSLFHAPAVQMCVLWKNSRKWTKYTKYSKRDGKYTKFQILASSTVARLHKKLGAKIRFFLPRA
jgi:hypothetical protein